MANARLDHSRTVFEIQSENGQAQQITLAGRTRWALECLMAAGANGCTPIDAPGPRWSAYIFELRRMGVQIETIHERHAGPFPGNHARYRLESTVTRLNRGVAA